MTRRPRRLGGAAALLLGVIIPLGVVAGSARADDVPRREVPDYDSRPERGDDEVDVLLWIPRILTGPLYLVAEYLIRIPLGAALTAIEESNLLQVLISFFGSGPGQNAAVLVTAFYDFGFSPSIGIYAYWNDFLVDHNRISLHAATWGEDWLSLSVADRATIGATQVFVRGGYLRRPDYLIGTEAALGQAVAGGPAALRYSSESVEGELGYRLSASGRSYVGASMWGRWARFGDTDYGGEPSVRRVARDHALDEPNGFDGYTVLALRVAGALDTRDASGVPSAGVRIEGRLEVARSVEGLGGTGWLTFGGEALAATDFLGGRRTFALSIEGAAILPTGAERMPFDLALDAGGRGPLQGFLPGSLRGLSAVAAILAYEWPVWVFLNGRIHVAVGNAFGVAFDGFGVERMRLSFGLGLAPTTPGDHPFEVGIAAGTDPFENGASVSSFRFFVGTRNDL